MYIHVSVHSVLFRAFFVHQDLVDFVWRASGCNITLGQPAANYVVGTVLRNLSKYEFNNQRGYNLLAIYSFFFPYFKLLLGRKYAIYNTVCKQEIVHDYREDNNNIQRAWGKPSARSATTILQTQ